MRPRDSESVAGTVPPTVPPVDVALTGTSNACTSFAAFTKDTSSDAPLASRAAVAPVSDNVLVPAATVNVWEARMPPIMSGAHGGVVPSAALHAESP